MSFKKRGLLINSHIGLFDTYCKNLFDSLKCKDFFDCIHVTIGGSPVEKKEFIDGITYSYVKHNSYDYGAFIDVLESELEVERWLYLHDTCIFKDDFCKLIKNPDWWQQRLVYANRNILASCNFGIYHHSVLKFHRDELMSLKNCSKATALLFEGFMINRNPDRKLIGRGTTKILKDIPKYIQGDARSRKCVDCEMIGVLKFHSMKWNYEAYFPPFQSITKALNTVCLFVAMADCSPQLQDILEDIIGKLKAKGLKIRCYLVSTSPFQKNYREFLRIRYLSKEGIHIFALSPYDSLFSFIQEHVSDADDIFMVIPNLNFKISEEESDILFKELNQSYLDGLVFHQKLKPRFIFPNYSDFIISSTFHLNYYQRSQRLNSYDFNILHESLAKNYHSVLVKYLHNRGRISIIRALFNDLYKLYKKVWRFVIRKTSRP